MLTLNKRRPTFRTAQGWAIQVLLEAGAIRECEEHGWMKDRAEPSIRSRGSLEDHTGLAHCRGDNLGIVSLPGDSLMEEIAAGAPSFQSRFHRRRRDREIVKAQRGLVGLEFSRHLFGLLREQRRL